MHPHIIDKEGHKSIFLLTFDKNEIILLYHQHEATFLEHDVNTNMSGQA
jgi:hypothetical protein